MPPILILVAAGAGLFFARRWYANERLRVAAALRAAEEALQRREQEAVPLERDPATGIYRPRHASQGASNQ
jgi:hypothetical protein